MWSCRITEASILPSKILQLSSLVDITLHVGQDEETSKHVQMLLQLRAPPHLLGSKGSVRPRSSRRVSIL